MGHPAGVIELLHDVLEKNCVSNWCQNHTLLCMSFLLLHFPLLIVPQSMCFKRIVSVHYDTEEYIPHIIFVCQIRMLLLFVFVLLCFLLTI